MKKLIIDQKKCVGCKTCTIIASKTFKIGESGKATTILKSKDKDKDIDLAIFSCPVQAISKSEK
ncbi:MAG: ferredoxin [bacterium]